MKKNFFISISDKPEEKKKQKKWDIIFGIPICVIAYIFLIMTKQHWFAGVIMACYFCVAVRRFILLVFRYFGIENIVMVTVRAMKLPKFFTKSIQAFSALISVILGLMALLFQNISFGIVYYVTSLVIDKIFTIDGFTIGVIALTAIILIGIDIAVIVLFTKGIHIPAIILMTIRFFLKAFVFGFNFAMWLYCGATTIITVVIAILVINTMQKIKNN